MKLIRKSKSDDLLGLPTLPVGAAYALWAKTYSPDAHNPFMALEQEAMLSLLGDKSLAGRSVLDLACGTGRYSRIAEQLGAARVIGVDSSAQMLGQILRKDSGRVIQASMDALPFADATFDVVICGLATGHLPPDAMRQAMAEMARVLRPGGDAFVSDFHPALYRLGGRRTFIASDGQTYNVEHYPHEFADYRQAAVAANMEIVAVREPKVLFRRQRVEAVLAFRCSHR